MAFYQKRDEVPYRRLVEPTPSRVDNLVDGVLRHVGIAVAQSVEHVTDQSILFIATKAILHHLECLPPLERMKTIDEVNTSQTAIRRHSAVTGGSIAERPTSRSNLSAARMDVSGEQADVRAFKRSCYPCGARTLGGVAVQPSVNYPQVGSGRLLRGAS